MERKFIKSGIPGLDEILGGGVLEGSVIAVSGPTGIGKSTLAAQFLYNGAVESDEPGIYICLEESRRDFFFHNSGYEWDFQSLEKDHRFILLDYPIHEVDQIVTQSSAIAEIIANTGTKRVVIDSIMPIALYFKNEEERKRGFLKLIENLHKWNVTTLIVSEDMKMANSDVRPSSEFGIESFADGWINMFFKYDEKAMDRTRYLEVIKMKGVAHSHRAFPALLGNSGFALMHELAPQKPAKAKPPAPKPEKPPEETVVSIEPGELMLPQPLEEERPEREEAKPEPAPEPPMRPLSSKRKLVRDEEMEQLKKLLEEEAGPAPKKEAAPKKKPAPKEPKAGPGGPSRPPQAPPQQAPAPKAPPSRPAPAAKMAPPAKAAPQKPLARPSGRPAPAKMSPSIQARLEEVKKKIMKKK